MVTKRNVIVSMKTFLWLMALWGLCGCGSSQKTATMDVHTERMDTSDDSLQYSLDRSLAMDEMIRRFGTVRLLWTEYDTGKPPVPTTGKPPVKREGEAHVELQTEQGKRTERGDSVRLKAAHNASSVTEGECHSVEKRKVESTGVMQHVGIMVAVLLVSVVGISVVKSLLASFKG